MELINVPNRIPNLRALDDLGLIQQAISGHQYAFTVLIDRYRSSVYHFISIRFPNCADAQDLTMEAFDKAFRKLDTFVPNYAFSTWLFKIARNNCIDFARRQRQTHACQAEFDPAKLSNLPDGRLDPEQAMIRQEHTVMLVRLLHQMNPRYRRMIELRFFEEMSYEEIAERLHIPIGTVKAQIFRAKETLRHLLHGPWASA